MRKIWEKYVFFSVTKVLPYSLDMMILNFKNTILLLKRDYFSKQTLTCLHITTNPRGPAPMMIKQLWPQPVVTTAQTDPNLFHQTQLSNHVTNYQATTSRKKIELWTWQLTKMAGLLCWLGLRAEPKFGNVCQFIKTTWLAWTWMSESVKDWVSEWGAFQTHEQQAAKKEHIHFSFSHGFARQAGAAHRNTKVSLSSRIHKLII